MSIEEEILNPPPQFTRGDVEGSEARSSADVTFGKTLDRNLNEFCYPRLALRPRLLDFLTEFSGAVFFTTTFLFRF